MSRSSVGNDTSAPHDSSIPILILIKDPKDGDRIITEKSEKFLKCSLIDSK